MDRPVNFSEMASTDNETAFVVQYREDIDKQLVRLTLAVAAKDFDAVGVLTAELTQFFFALGREYEKK